MMPCPCTICLNHIEHKVEEVQFYLFKYGIDLSYTKWDKHGEKDEQATAAQIPVNATTEFVDDMESFDEETLPIKLLNLKGKYGASDKFFTESLGLLKKMLPAGNEMDNKELTVCPTCGISRWKVDNKTHKVYENIPAKVMWYFPIIPRLQRLFKLESISEDLRWHATRRITDGVLRHPADSQAWRTIDEKFPKTAVSFINSFELEEEAKRQEEASMAALAKLYDVVQAQIDADQELAARMTLEEYEKYIVKERARMLAEFIKNRKKQLAVERAKAIRSKPPTKSQLRNLMMTYLKNTGRSKEDKRRIKDLNTKAEEGSSNKDVDSTNKRNKRIRMKRSSKKQMTDADIKEEEQLKTLLSIVPNEEEAIDYEVLDKRVFRADGSSRYIKTFTKMGDLKTMFEANAVDELRKNQEDWILKSWNLYENYGVHILMLKDGTEFHMLAERKYPLIKETLEKMLVLRLTAESVSEAAFDLLRFIQKQIDERWSKDVFGYILLMIKMLHMKKLDD
ncbi:ribonuclease H-like domain, reverse transcriptase, RNA-dependent DNA polymerase [Tanacetum coccineum]|uniref:Ribonuclease H-like domain, reverse transcriptase, RNA-dependent DNA polymerase n=1 Tax=Tanacetum coccineum TaxID=301880 RepID=A0ABQ5BX75_9ASTR